MAGRWTRLLGVPPLSRTGGTPLGSRMSDWTNPRSWSSLSFLTSRTFRVRGSFTLTLTRLRTFRRSDVTSGRASRMEAERATAPAQTFTRARTRRRERSGAERSCWNGLRWTVGMAAFFLGFRPSLPWCAGYIAVEWKNTFSWTGQLDQFRS